jgi:alpha-tubulin suppressor-like RCC1 family protein
MKQDENEQNYKKDSTTVVGQKPNGKSQLTSDMCIVKYSLGCVPFVFRHSVFMIRVLPHISRLAIYAACGLGLCKIMPTLSRASPVILAGGASLTNLCYTPFVDPGAFVIAPLTGIAAGSYYSLALKSDGTVAAWGSPPQVPLQLNNVKAIAAGYIHSLALKADGTVIGWGDDSYGETDPPVGLNNVVAISAGWGFSLALESDGTVVGWGLGETNPPAYDGLHFGQALVPPGLSNVVSVAAGFDSSLALKSDGTLVSWGRAQPWLGIYPGDYSGIQIPDNVNSIVAIAAGGDFGLALISDGTVVGLGYNGEGQANAPDELSDVIAIAAGFYHSLALKSDGTIVGWGDDFYGESSPPLGLTNVIAVAAGAYHSLALESDGTVVGWGLDSYGETDITTGGTNLITSIPASGEVNSNKPGLYILTYTATNSLGVVSSTSRTVTVILPPPPIIGISETFSGQPLGIPTLSVQSIVSGHIELSTNLINWSTLTDFVGSDATLTFLDTGATNSSLRFYRASIP